MMSGRYELLLYVVAGAIYVTLGVFWWRVLLSWVEGTAFLLLAVWIIPYAVRRATGR